MVRFILAASVLCCTNHNGISSYQILQNSHDSAETWVGEKQKKQYSKKNIPKLKRAWALKEGIMCQGEESPDFCACLPASTALGQRRSCHSEGRRISGKRKGNMPQHCEFSQRRRNTKNWSDLNYVQKQVEKK